MKIRIHIFVSLLFFLFIGFSLSAEEQKFYKPSDFRDISNCVISWEPIFGEKKVYDLAKGEYPYPPGDRYKAKDGWNSYPDGCEIPVTNYSLDEECPENAFEPYKELREESYFLNLFDTQFHVGCPSPSDHRRIDSLFPNTYWPIEVDFNIYKKIRKNIAIGTVIFSRRNTWLAIKAMSTKDYVDILTTDDVFRISVDEKGDCEKELIPGYTGLQLLCCYKSSKTGLTGTTSGKLIFLDAQENGLLVLDGSGQSWRMPFFKRKFDTECWGCEHVEETANFPSLLLYDRNYGIPRNAIPPPSLDPETGIPTGNWRYWKPRIIPEKPQSRYVQLNLKTGEVEATYEGIHYARLRTPDIVEIPNVALDGCLGSALMKMYKQVAFLPYDWITKEGLRICHTFPTDYKDVFVYSDGIDVLDYEKLTLTQYRYIGGMINESKLSGIHRGRFATIVVSNPHGFDGKNVITILCYSLPVRTFSPRLYCCATVPADFIISGDKRVLFSFNGESIFIDNSGELLRIDVPREALK